MTKSSCGLFAGSWKAYTPDMAGIFHLLDERHCTQPIIPHLPQPSRTTQPPKVQRLVDEWHRCIDRIQCLDVVPPAIILQLHRFTRQRSRIHKNHAQVILDDHIRVPVLQGARPDSRHDTYRVTYKLCAFIEHRGNTPHTGHYTATLAQDGFWSCDDNRVARWRPALSTSQSKSCYALFYCLSSALPEHATAS